MLPGLVGMELLPASNAIFQSLFQTGAIVGPAVAGLLLAGAGVHLIYWIDVASFLVAMTAVLDDVAAAAARRPGTPGGRRRAARAGARRSRGCGSSGGPSRCSARTSSTSTRWCSACPGRCSRRWRRPSSAAGRPPWGCSTRRRGPGALLGALTSGWVGRVRRQGLAVICAVLVWGAAIAGFGVARWLPLALVLLAVAGWADVLSAVFRNTIIQFAGPDGMRGRLMGVQMAVVAGGPRLGDLEAGAVATAFGDTVSVVSGGLACIVGALAARLVAARVHQAALGPARAGRGTAGRGCGPGRGGRQGRRDRAGGATRGRCR